MVAKVLVANRQIAEAGLVAAALSANYEVFPVHDGKSLISRIEAADALILDADFTDAQGVDVLMTVMSRVRIPVLMTVTLADQLCAVEAMRCGAAGYLVKDGHYLGLIPTALGEIMSRFSAIDSLKQEIIDLRRQLAQRTGLAGAGAAKGKPGGIAGHGVAPRGSRMLELVAARLDRGELTLPAFPKIAIKLREMLDADIGILEIAKLLSQDAGISAKLLQLANSAQFANARKTDSVEGAVSRVGLLSACNVAEMVVNQSLYATRNAAYLPMFATLWEHSVACAHACVVLGRNIDAILSPKLFLLGLLHDVGKLAILQALAQSDPKGIQVSSEKEATELQRFLQAEHTKTGVAAMRRWRFDEDFVAVACHHDDLRGAGAGSRPLMIVHFANLLVRSRGYGNALDSPGALDAAPSRAFLFPGGIDLERVNLEIDQAMKSTRSLLA